MNPITFFWVCMFVGIGVAIVYGFVEITELDELCVDNGYERVTNIPHEEEYIVCCKDVYVDHIKVEDECKAIKR